MYRCVQGTWTELRPWTNEGKIHLLTDPSSNSFTKYISLVSKYNPRDFTYIQSCIWYPFSWLVLGGLVGLPEYYRDFLSILLPFMALLNPMTYRFLVSLSHGKFKGISRPNRTFLKLKFWSSRHSSHDSL